MTETAIRTRKSSRWCFDWRVFAIGLVLLFVAAIAAVPFVQTLLTVTEGGSSPSDLALFSAQVLVEGAFALALGLFLGGRIGLGFSLIPRWVRKESVGRKALGALQRAIVVAILGAVGVVLLGSVSVLVALALGVDMETLADMGTTGLMRSYPAPWKWFLISMNAGIAEEIVFRLGLLTLLAWLGGLVWRDEDGRPTKAVFWTANFLAGLAFGVGHLFGGIPYPKVPFVMARIVVQNTALGVVLGWLYRRWGLETAMLAHFLIDVVFYVLLIPSLQSQNVLLMIAAPLSLALALAWAWRGLRRLAWEEGLKGPSPYPTQ